LLSFESQDEGDDAPTSFELRLTGDGRAELQFVNPPVKIKPIRFERKRLAALEVEHVPQAFEIVGPENRRALGPRRALAA
jgi:hypothetical protein